MRKLSLLLLMAIAFIFFNKADAQEDSTRVVEGSNEQNYMKILNSEMNDMLDLWYVKKEVSNSKSILSKFTDEEVTVENMDSIYSERVSKISTIVALGYNSSVRSYINLYANSRKRSSSAILGLAQYYYPWMFEIFDKYDVPEELVYLTIIESSLNPVAVSPAGATGIWQFMYTTGKMYGLEVNSFIDDRRDPVKATDAAARHAKDLHDMFNGWGLAISAYNCGPGNVRKAIYRSGGKTTFWEVRQFLPRETQNYFPAYIGAYYMMNYYKAHDIIPAKISIPTNVDTVMVKKELHFEQIAHVLQINIDEIRTLNPQYKRDVIPAFTEMYPLKLKSNDIIRFLAMKDSIYKYNYDVYFAPLQTYVNVFTGKGDSTPHTTKKYHKVRSGETLSKIATRYGLSVSELKKMNKLKSNYLKVGQRLVVGYNYTTPPQTDNKTNTEQKTTEQNTTSPNETNSNTPPKSSTETATSQSQYTIHTVKKGETLSVIASRYKMTVKKIAAFNNIRDVNSLKVGQKIKIPK